MAEIIKVYCHNCRYKGFFSINAHTAWSWCENWEAHIEYKSVAIQKHKLNGTFQCPYYKRQWFRFWVREKVSITGAFPNAQDIKEFIDYLKENKPEIIFSYLMKRR